MYWRSRWLLSATGTQLGIELLLRRGCGVRSFNVLRDDSVHVVATQPAIMVGCVHIVPMCHLASQSFYDAVLAFMHDSCKEVLDYGEHAPVLLEGLLDDAAARAAQEREYATIQNDHSLCERLREAALQNTLYHLDTQRDICEQDLKVPWAAVAPYFPSSQGGSGLLRLQDLYFKPLVASSSAFAATPADLTIEEALRAYYHGDDHCNSGEASSYEGVAEAAASMGGLLALGRSPLVRAAREAYCVDAALTLLERHAGSGSCPMQIFIPWGFHHSDALLDRFLHRVRHRPSSGPMRWFAEEMQAEGKAVRRTFSFGLPDDVVKAMCTTCSS